MRRSSIVEIVVFCGLLVSGVVLRILLRDIPNFAPVAAVALFAGFYFRSAVAAATLPLLIMGISDYWIGAYAPQMMLVVYTMLAIPVACRGWLRRSWHSSAPSARKPLFTLLGCSFLASVAFFFVTNLGAWVWFDMYDHTWSGLLECYVAALPFYRYTLAGDLCFGFALFGGYRQAWSAGLASELPGRMASAGDR